MKLTAVLMAIAACAAGPPTVPAVSSTEDAASWSIEACPLAYEKLFGEIKLAEVGGGSAFPRVEIVLGGEWTLDTVLVLTKPGKDIRVQMLQSFPLPLCEQLIQFRTAKPALELEDLLPRVRIRSATMTSASLPELPEHLALLRELGVRVWPSDSLVFPARTVQLTIEGIGGRATIEYSEPDPAAQGVAYTTSPLPSDEGLAAWVRTLLQILGIETRVGASGE